MEIFKQALVAHCLLCCNLQSAFQVRTLVYSTVNSWKQKIWHIWTGLRLANALASTEMLCLNVSPDEQTLLRLIIHILNRMSYVKPSCPKAPRRIYIQSASTRTGLNKYCSCQCWHAEGFALAVGAGFLCDGIA